jgi:hypothetical protein
MSVPDLRALMESLDWQDVLSNRAPRRHRPIRTEQADNRASTRLEVGFNGGRFRLSTGIVTGHNLERTLCSATLPVAHIRAFEDLPIPFVAVATDLITGEMAVLDRGNLSTAMQASMSLPGAFLTAFSRGRNTMLLGGRAGSAIDSTLPVHHDFALGGFQRMSGLLPRDMVGNHYGFAHVTVQTRLATLPTALQGGGLYVGLSLEGGNVWDDTRSVRLRDAEGSASVFVGADTLVGPLFLSYGRTASGEDKVYLLLGRGL